MSVYITLVEAKAHLRVDFTDDDTYIQALCDMVEEVVLTEIQGEHETTIEGTVETDETTSITGTETNFLDYEPGDIIRVQGETPRVIASISADTSMVVAEAMDATASGLTYVIYTGYPALNTTLPLGLKHAMLLMVGHYYMIREPVAIGVGVTDIPLSFKYLVAPYKNYTVR
jgi:hypothetical protein